MHFLTRLIYWSFKTFGLSFSAKIINWKEQNQMICQLVKNDENKFQIRTSVRG